MKGQPKKKSNVVVTICDDYVIRDPEEIQRILNRVSKIVSGAYARGEQK